MNEAQELHIPAPVSSPIKMESLDYTIPKSLLVLKCVCVELTEFGTGTLYHHPQSQLPTLKPLTVEILSPKELFNQRILE